MTIKQERAAHLIHNILSELLMTEVTDPALDGITVTEVKVDREIEYAEVFVHGFGDQKEIMHGLERATGFLRRELAARTRFRKTPMLHFHWDAAVEHGERIDQLLNTLHDDNPKPPAREETEDGLE